MIFGQVVVVVVAAAEIKLKLKALDTVAISWFLDYYFLSDQRSFIEPGKFYPLWE